MSNNGVPTVDAAALSIPVPPPPPLPPPPGFQHAIVASALPPGKPKKRHTLRWIVAITAALIVILILATSASKATKTRAASSTTASTAPGSASKTTASPSGTSAAVTTTVTTAPPSGTSAAVPTTVSKGLGAKDASADVTNLKIGDADIIGFRSLTATVTNNSSKRSNYFIEVSIESADGKTQIDTATLVVSNLEPGQATEAKGISTAKDLPSGAQISLKQVTRLASS